MMGLKRWTTQFRRRLRGGSLRSATLRSGWELVNGGLHRTIAGQIGTTIWNEDWDIIVILDAARADTFREVAVEFDWLDASDIRSYWSVGSYSGSWVARTFGSEYHSEMRKTAYITGNDWPTRDVSWEPSLPINTDVFPLFLPVSDVCWMDIDGTETVDPRPLTDIAINAWRNRKRHDFDRLVIHYMQPHQPFIGYPEFTVGSSEADENNSEGRTNFGVWDRAYRNEVDRAELMAAYRDNLRYVLRFVDELQRNADAQIALTADHGNAFGELAQWGHPAGSLHPAVRKVPWVRVEGTDKRTNEGLSVAETQNRIEASTDENIEDRLKQLGYL